MSVALGHAMNAHRQFTKLKSSVVSPDGLLGGRGYVMGVKDIRAKLYESCEYLSAISDTLHDEIHAPHWKPKLAELEKSDKEDLQNLLSDADQNLEDPEEEAVEQMEEAEERGAWGPKNKKNQEESGSMVPRGGDSEVVNRKPLLRKEANSSVSPDSLPGPRVQHLDRADQDQTGPLGSYNSEEPWDLSAPWGQMGGVTYNTNRERYSQSVLPDDDTPTEGYDFGLGYGARGQGMQHVNPSSKGKGVYGPKAKLPEGDSNYYVDDSMLSIERQIGGGPSSWVASSDLPGDYDDLVARSDYYVGPSGNDVTSTSSLPQEVVVQDGMRVVEGPRAWTTEQQRTPRVLWDGAVSKNRHDPLFMTDPEGPWKVE
jgi:hypothetical protein